MIQPFLSPYHSQRFSLSHSKPSPPISSFFFSHLPFHKPCCLRSSGFAHFDILVLNLTLANSPASAQRSAERKYSPGKGDGEARTLVVNIIWELNFTTITKIISLGNILRVSNYHELLKITERFWNWGPPIIIS